jgi:hypothetical protein
LEKEKLCFYCGGTVGVFFNDQWVSRYKRLRSTGVEDARIS